MRFGTSFKDFSYETSHQEFINILIVFLLSMGLGFATQNKIVINGIILVFIIHWALYIPANIFKTENFMI